ncbi:MAG: cation:proton antiporter [Verrucomicrobiia bacterium]
MESGLDLIPDLALLMLVAAGAGWVCKRLGLSLVIGYLIAGILIGPFSPFVPILKETERIGILSQLGLVFLIFSIGTGLGLQRLKRLGLPVIIGTVVGVIVTLNAGRAVGFVMGLTMLQSLFLAGLWVVSSSAIIIKVLQETDSAHERHGQLALGVTVVEDVVAVAMLTVLGSLAMGVGSTTVGVGQVLRNLGLFVVLVFAVAMLVVPWIMRRLDEEAPVELQSVAVTALLLGLSTLALSSGYSLALGAFLLGSIIGSTPYRGRVERFTEGLRDVFGAVFFVSMGMLFDLRQLSEVWPLAVGLTAGALLLRFIGVGLGLVLAGQPPRDAFRAGICATPLGEFSFIIAQLGVVSGIMPVWFFPVAVAMSLGSAIVAPPLVRRASGCVRFAGHLVPGWVKDLGRLHGEWLEAIRFRLAGSLLWKLTGKRFAQVGMEMVAVSALVLFSSVLYHHLESFVGPDLLFPSGTLVLFTVVMGAFIAIPLLAIWRNLEALSMIFADAITLNAGGSISVKAVVQPALRVAAFLMILVWIGTLLPSGAASTTVFLLGIVVALAMALVFWRRMIRWHSLAEIKLNQLLQPIGGSEPRSQQVLSLDPGEEWGMHVREMTLLDSSRALGLPISALPLRPQFNCSIASIERQGVMIPNPSASTILFPNDRLLLLGRADELDRAEDWLSEVSQEKTRGDAGFAELQLALVKVPPNCTRVCGKLRDLAPHMLMGVQITGVQRGSDRILNPGGDFILQPGDNLLVLGRQDQISAFQHCLILPSPAKSPQSSSPAT